MVNGYHGDGLIGGSDDDDDENFDQSLNELRIHE